MCLYLLPLSNSSINRFYVLSLEEASSSVQINSHCGIPSHVFPKEMLVVYSVCFPYRRMIDFFEDLFVCVSECFLSCMCVHQPQCPQRPKESFGIPRTKVTGSCELSCEFKRMNPDPLCKQRVFITTEPLLWAK